MAMLLNSTWRCGCGARQTEAPTSYDHALQALRRHQEQTACTKQRGGPGDRIHSEPPSKTATGVIDRERPEALHGPPRPPAARRRRGREGLPWLPGNEHT